nr:hypothetical protein [Tanacetum cinerariifolium]
MGKSKKKRHKPKSEDTNQEKLYLLHIDLYGLMRVASVNGKKHLSDESEKIMELNVLIKLYVNIMKRLASLMKHLLLALYGKMVSLKDVIIRFDLPAPEVIAPIAEVVALKPVASTSSPSSTTVDQDAPSPSNSQTSLETLSPIIFNDVEEENHKLDVAHMNNDTFFGISIPENVSEASSSSDVIPTVVHTAAPNSEHVNK